MTRSTRPTWLSWPFGRGATQAREAGPAPEHRTYVVGDIHGRDDLIGVLLDQIKAHHAEDPVGSHLVFAGDYVDRGPESAAVLDRVRSLEPGPYLSVTCLRGNHEEMMLAFLSAASLQSGTQWLRNGGDSTAWSFGIAPPEELSDDAMADFAAALSEAMPDGLRDWLASRPLKWVSGNLVVVHAGLDPKRAFADQSPETMLWTRPKPRARRRDGLWVAHGHTVTRPPEIADERIPVDTGAWFTGLLTAAIIEPNGRVQYLDTASAYPMDALPAG